MPDSLLLPRDAINLVPTPPASLDIGSLPQLQESGRMASVGSGGASRAVKRNYSTLVSALQTLGYSISGFVATAVITLEGQPIAQVAIDDLDISSMYGYFSTILQGALRSLDHVGGGNYEDTMITSSDRYLLLRFIGNAKDIFQVLITTREADPLASLEMMANVEEAISAALR